MEADAQSLGIYHDYPRILRILLMQGSMDYGRLPFLSCLLVHNRYKEILRYRIRTETEGRPIVNIFVIVN